MPDICKIRCSLFPETSPDSPARQCTYDPVWCGCNKADPETGFCFQRIPEEPQRRHVEHEIQSPLLDPVRPVAWGYS